MNCLDSVSLKIADTELTDALNEYCNDNDLTMQTSNMSTKSGKQVLHIKLEDNSSSDATDLYFIKENSGHTISVEQYKFGTKLAVPHDAMALRAVCHLVTEKKGDFKGVIDETPCFIAKGKSVPCEIMVVKAGTKGQIAEEDDGTGISTSVGSFKVLKPIKQYLEENPNLYNNLKGLPFPENFNRLGKYVLKQKIDGDMEFVEFKDLFGQVMILGADDAKLKQFWELLR